MSDNVPFDMQDAPWDFDIDYDFDQWVDPNLLDFSIPDWPGSTDPIDWIADTPDALGSFNADPVSDTSFVDLAFGIGSRLGLSHTDKCMPGHYVLTHEEGIVTHYPKQAHFVERDDEDRTAVVSSITSDSSGIPEPHRKTPDLGRASTRRGRKPLPDNLNAFRCDACENGVTFSRNSDLRRHMRIKHGHRRSAAFMCGAHGCFKGQLPWSFARPDKLTSHIKTTHNRNTIFTKCPIVDCSFGPCALEVLGVHVHHLHRDHEHGRAVLNATSYKALQCPLWRCGKYVTAKKFPDHVSGHSVEEVQAALPNIQSMSLVVKVAPENAQASSAKSNMTIGVLCPVCNKVNDNFEQFIAHLWTDHLFAFGGAEHFDEWKAEWASKTQSYNRSAICNVSPWSRPAYWVEFAKRCDYKCPSCPFIIADFGYDRRGDEEMARKKDAISSHHLSLLRPEAQVVNELHPYRWQILRLYPEFVTHPVFDDFKQAQQQSVSSPSEAQLASSDLVNNDFEMSHWTPVDFNSYL